MEGETVGQPLAYPGSQAETQPAPGAQQVVLVPVQVVPAQPVQPIQPIQQVQQVQPAQSSAVPLNVPGI